MVDKNAIKFHFEYLLKNRWWKNDSILVRNRLGMKNHDQRSIRNKGRPNFHKTECMDVCYCVLQCRVVGVYDLLWGGLPLVWMQRLWLEAMVWREVVVMNGREIDALCVVVWICNGSDVVLLMRMWLHIWRDIECVGLVWSWIVW